MKVMFIHRWTLAFRFCFALLFLCCAAPLKCATQSASSVKADAASRASATYQHGMSALQKGDLVSARADFEKVVRLAPNSPEGHNSLGWVLLAQGEIDSAIVHFRAAVKLNPDFALAHMNFSSALSRKGDVAAALREAKEAVRLARDDSETHHILARTLDFSGDLDGAIGEFRRAIELEPKRAELHDDLGAVLVQKSDAQGAAAEFSEALRLQPDFAQAHFHLGVLRYQERSLEEAAQHLQTAVQLNSAEPGARYYLAQVFKSKGDAAAAIRELQTCVELSSDYPDAQNSLALLLQRSGAIDGRDAQGRGVGPRASGRALHARSDALAARGFCRGRGGTPLCDSREAGLCGGVLYAGNGLETEGRAARFRVGFARSYPFAAGFRGRSYHFGNRAPPAWRRRRRCSRKQNGSGYRETEDERAGGALRHKFGPPATQRGGSRWRHFAIPGGDPLFAKLCRGAF